MQSDSRPAQRLVEQRIRNWIIEYLELASSFDAQQAHDRDTIAFVPAEVIELWADWSPEDQSVWPGRLMEPYSDEEIEAMREFDTEWNETTEHSPNPLPQLNVLQRRGRLSVDHEA